MAGLTKKGSTYYALFTLNGKTIWKKIGKVPYRDALKAKRLLESELDKGRFGFIESKSISLIEFKEQYLKYSKANKSPRTWERDITSLKALMPFFGNMLLESINEHHIEEYKQKRLSDGVKPKTINIELYCLSNMLRRAIEWNYLKQLPKIKFLKYQSKPPRFLSEAEMQELMDSASPWLQPVLLVLRNTGLRVSELCRLAWKDIDFENDLLLVMNSKGNDYRPIPINEELRTTLLFLKENYVLQKQCRTIPRSRKQMQYVFCHIDGSPLKSFRTSFEKAVKKSGLLNVTPHTLRHSFASHLVMNGVDLPTVKELLGHKNIVTTMIYAHLSNEHKAKAVKKLSWAKPKLKLA